MIGVGVSRNPDAEAFAVDEVHESFGGNEFADNAAKEELRQSAVVAFADDFGIAYIMLDWIYLRTKLGYSESPATLSTRMSISRKEE